MTAASSPGGAPADAGAAVLVSAVRRGLVQALTEHAGEAGDREPSVRGMTAAQLASALDLHVTTVRFHLDRLVAAGIVTSEFTKAFGVGRPRKVYDLAPRGAAPQPEVRAVAGERAGPGSLRLLAELLTESFGRQLTPEQAGEQWAAEHVDPGDLRGDSPADTTGAWLSKVGRVIDVLQEWGYSPDLATSDAGRSCRIDLVRCPFFDLARANPAVVCAIHRGLIQGVLRQMGEADADVVLEPFVEPERCRAEVSTRTPFRTRTVRAEAR